MCESHTSAAVSACMHVHTCMGWTSTATYIGYGSMEPGHNLLHSTMATPSPPLCILLRTTLLPAPRQGALVQVVPIPPGRGPTPSITHPHAWDQSLQRGGNDLSHALRQMHVGLARGATMPIYSRHRYDTVCWETINVGNPVRTAKFRIQVDTRLLRAVSFKYETGKPALA